MQNLAVGDKITIEIQVKYVGVGGIDFVGNGLIEGLNVQWGKLKKHGYGDANAPASEMARKLAKGNT